MAFLLHFYSYFLIIFYTKFYQKIIKNFTEYLFFFKNVHKIFSNYMVSLSEVKALIYLLGDDDDEVRKEIYQKILSLGAFVVPFLEEAWIQESNTHTQALIEQIITKIQKGGFFDKIKTWVKSPEMDILEGACLLASYQTPDLNIQKIKKQINDLYYDIWLTHKPKESIEYQVKNLSTHFFQKLNFKVGALTEPHIPEHTFINRVLEKREGTPLTLSIIYMTIAQKLKMNVYGVNFPNFFLMKSPSDYKPNQNHYREFFIVPLNAGEITYRPDLEDYLKGINFPNDEVYFAEASSLDMMQRMTRNLVLSYTFLDDERKTNDMKKVLDMLGGA